MGGHIPTLLIWVCRPCILLHKLLPQHQPQPHLKLQRRSEKILSSVGRSQTSRLHTWTRWKTRYTNHTCKIHLSLQLKEQAFFTSLSNCLHTQKSTGGGCKEQRNQKTRLKMDYYFKAKTKRLKADGRVTLFRNKRFALNLMI